MIARPCAIGAAALASALALSPAAVAAAPSGAALVPEGAAAALLLDGARGAQGLRAFFASAARFAPALDPAALGADLERAIGVDLLAGGEAFLAPSGTRALVVAASARGSASPVRDPAAATRALRRWLAQAGPQRAGRREARGVLRAGAGARLRAGAIAQAGGRRLLLTASGPGAMELVLALARAARSPRASLLRSPAPARALAATRSPAVLWLRGGAPVQGAVLALDASAGGLRATGPLLPEPPAVLFAGAAPDLSCPPGALLCASASLGPSAPGLLARAVREWAARALPRPASAAFLQLLSAAAAAAQGPALLRVDRFSARALATADEPLQAVSFLGQAAAPGAAAPGPAALPNSLSRLPDGIALRGDFSLCARAGGGAVSLAAPCPDQAPSAPSPGGDAGLVLAARLDPSALARSLAKLSPLDALRSEAAAGAYAAHLFVGPLLARSGPLSLAGRPLPGGAVALDLRWPLPPGDAGLPERAGSK